MQASTTSASASVSRDGRTRRPGADEFGEMLAAARRAIAHDDRPCAGAMERRRHPDAHVAGTDDEDLLAAQGPETLVDHLDRGVADRRRTLPDRRLVRTRLPTRSA